MQEEIDKNCLNASYNSLMKFDNYRSHNHDQEMRLLLGNGNRPINFDSEMNNIVLKSFKGTNKFMFLGAMSFIFYFLALYTFFFGLAPTLFYRRTGNPRSNPMLTPSEEEI